MLSARMHKCHYLFLIVVLLVSLLVPYGASEVDAVGSDRERNGYGFTQIAAGREFALGLKPNGTVVGWGNNLFGQLNVPAGLSGVAAIAAGVEHSLALKSDGTVVAWGFNDRNQSIVPAGLNNVTAIAAGNRHSLALKSDGTVTVWGNGDFGNSNLPAGLSGVVAIAGGAYHSLALKSDGTVVAWGYNSFGQSTIPAGLNGVVAIAAGYFHSLALKSDGTVVAWGRSDSGETTPPTGLSGVVAIAAGQGYSLALKSDGTVVEWGGQAPPPAGLSGVAAIAAGQNYSLALKSDGTIVSWGLNIGTAPDLTLPIRGAHIAAGNFHSLALKSDGTVAGWGSNDNGQATPLAGLSGVAALDGGDAFSLALKSDGEVVAWGFNASGQADVPVGLNQVTEIAAGSRHSLALKSDGKVVAWGANGNGQSNVPDGLEQVVAIAAGGTHSLALKSDGKVVAWGDNAFGTVDYATGLSSVVAIAAGFQHSVALKADGTIVVWGTNSSGQLNMPADLSGVIAIAAGDTHSLALKSDGTVVAWGNNVYGQANPPAGLSDVVAIAGGGEHSLALRSDGTVVAWGYNALKQLNVPGFNLQNLTVQDGTLQEPFQSSVTSYTHYYKGPSAGSVIITPTLETPAHAEMYTGDAGDRTRVLNGSAITVDVSEAVSDIVIPIHLEPHLREGRTYTITLSIDSVGPAVQFDTNGRTTAAQTAATAVTVSDTLSGVDDGSLQYAWSASAAVPTTGWAAFENGDTLGQSSGNGNWYLHIRASDMAGNEVNVASNPFLLDNTAPTATVSSSASTYIKSAFPVTITFSEDVIDFAEEDLVVVNGTASEWEVVNATTYRALITPVTSGQQVSVSVDAGVAHDVAGNENAASNTFQVEYNTEKPVVTFGGFMSNETFIAPPGSVTVTIGETVHWIEDDAPLTSANALPLISMTRDGSPFSDYTPSYDALLRTFTLLFDTPLSDGEYEVNVAGDVVHSLYGHTLDAASSTFTVAVPRITSLSASPESLASVGGNTTITLTGENLTGQTVTVYADGVEADTAVISSDTSATANVALPYNSDLSAKEYLITVGLNGDLIAGVEDTVSVDGNHIPVLTLIGSNTMQVVAGGTFTDPGASAWDEEDLDLSPSISISGSVNTNVTGTYTLTYSVQDTSGHDAVELVRTVHVVQPVYYFPSSNASLKQLLITSEDETLSLIPAFTTGTLVYHTETRAERVELEMAADHAGASIRWLDEQLGASGKLTIPLAIGNNEIPLTVRAEDGTVRTYTITIHRTAPDGGEGNTPSITECTFRDIAGHWAEEPICEAAAQGLVQGDDAGMFHPQRQVTRIEFAAMLLRALEISSEGESRVLTFADADRIPDWAKDVASAAVNAGVLEGYLDGTLRPLQTVSRSEMAAMMTRALEQSLGGEASTNGEASTSGEASLSGDTTAPFADDADIPDWARGYIYTASQHGLLFGRGDNLFVPNGLATRAEAAVTILRLWQIIQ
ncbi:S-layer homology domain-containing protein [Paenibacillus sp. PAMC21692]|uniref:RCC1 domain-containing protein n=1 Tax=Paenibacillus sp. PAMC21692 TaxID=2762320 RepID=UPI00164DAE28|nr:S-layer homology domain-containing protein [Paenibacillus sp. PAMC21692]QNK58673.1 S-layer homology domain-containing protein [Paenibacillus sp. PAMC21692]